MSRLSKFDRDYITKRIKKEANGLEWDTYDVDEDDFDENEYEKQEWIKEHIVHELLETVIESYGFKLRGVSGVSPSTYWEKDIEIGDELETVEIRISDHEDHHYRGNRVTILYPEIDNTNKGILAAVSAAVSAVMKKINETKESYVGCTWQHGPGYLQADWPGLFILGYCRTARIP